MNILLTVWVATHTTKYVHFILIDDYDDQYSQLPEDGLVRLALSTTEIQWSNAG